MSKGNAVKGDRATHSMTNPAFHAEDIEDGTYEYHKSPDGSLSNYSNSLVSSPPTPAELESIFGSPVEGFFGILNNDGGEMYFIASDGVYWFCTQMTVAEDLSP
jgi:hypothetical protein